LPPQSSQLLLADHAPGLVVLELEEADGLLDLVGVLLAEPCAKALFVPVV
jgi:hypothetical protein